MFPIARERIGDADVVQNASARAGTGDGGARTGEVAGDGLQDENRSKGRRVGGVDDSSRPPLPPPMAPGAQVPPAADEPAGGEGPGDSDEEGVRVPRVRHDPAKPTVRERL